MIVDIDELTSQIAASLEANGLIACVQPPRDGGHVRWGGRYGRGGPMDGVRWVLVQSTDAGWPPIATLQIEDESDHGGYHNLGFGYDHKRVGTMRWRIAEGYTNGFRKRDILWYALTRWFGNVAYVKKRRKLK